MQTLLEISYDNGDGAIKIVGLANKNKFPIQFKNCSKELKFTMEEVDQIIDVLLKFRMRNPD